MIDVRASRVVHAPVEEVFEFMADLNKLPQWLEGCRRAWSPSGDPRSLGARVVHEDEFMGQTFEAHFDVVGWEDNRRMVFETVSGPFRGRSEESFAAEGDATRVEIRVTGEPAGFLKAVGWLAGRKAQSQVDRSLDNVKRLLERG